MCVCVNVVTDYLNVIYNKWYEPVNEEINTVSELNDMIDVRDGLGSCAILNTEDASCIINDNDTKRKPYG